MLQKLINKKMLMIYSKAKKIVTTASILKGAAAPPPLEAKKYIINCYNLNDHGFVP